MATPTEADRERACRKLCRIPGQEETCGTRQEKRVCKSACIMSEHWTDERERILGLLDEFIEKGKALLDADNLMQRCFVNGVKRARGIVAGTKPDERRDDTCSPEPRREVETPSD